MSCLVSFLPSPPQRKGGNPQFQKKSATKTKHHDNLTHLNLKVSIFGCFKPEKPHNKKPPKKDGKLDLLRYVGHATLFGFRDLSPQDDTDASFGASTLWWGCRPVIHCWSDLAGGTKYIVCSSFKDVVLNLHTHLSRNSSCWRKYFSSTRLKPPTRGSSFLSKFESYLHLFEIMMRQVFGFQNASSESSKVTTTHLLVGHDW